MQNALCASDFCSLRKVGHQLWVCCGKNGIIKLDPEELQRPNEDAVIACGEMGVIQDVVETSTDNVIIAARTGLYLYDVAGKGFSLVCYVRQQVHVFSILIKWHFVLFCRCILKCKMQNVLCLQRYNLNHSHSISTGSARVLPVPSYGTCR